MQWNADGAEAGSDFAYAGMRLISIKTKAPPVAGLKGKVTSYWFTGILMIFFWMAYVTS